jgi:hypothetical protein
MKKKTLIKFALVASVILGGSILALSSSSYNNAFAEEPQEAPSLAQDLPLTEDLPLMEQAYQQASVQQKQALDEISQESILGEERTKEILQVIGAIPSDQQKLTLVEARDIVNQYTSYTSAISSKQELSTQSVSIKEQSLDIMQEFNEIAGAPDSENGLNWRLYVYFLNDAGDETICVNEWGHIDHRWLDENGDLQIEYLNPPQEVMDILLNEFTQQYPELVSEASNP